MKIKPEELSTVTKNHVNTLATWPANKKPLHSAAMGISHAAGRIYIQSVARDGTIFAQGAMELETASLFVEDLRRQIAMAAL